MRLPVISSIRKRFNFFFFKAVQSFANIKAMLIHTYTNINIFKNIIRYPAPKNHTFNDDKN